MKTFMLIVEKKSTHGTLGRITSKKERRKSTKEGYNANDAHDSRQGVRMLYFFFDSVKIVETSFRKVKKSRVKSKLELRFAIVIIRALELLKQAENLEKLRCRIFPLLLFPKCE